MDDRMIERVVERVIRSRIGSLLAPRSVPLTALRKDVGLFEPHVGKPPITTWIEAGLPGIAASGRGNSTPDAGTLYYVPFRVRKAVRITAAHAYVSTAGAAGSNFRMGVVRIDNDFVPGAAMADFGLQPSDAVALRSVTLGTPVTLEPGLYATVFIASGGAFQWISAALDDLICYVASTGFSHWAFRSRAGQDAVRTGGFTNGMPAPNDGALSSSGGIRSFVLLEWNNV